MKKTNSLLILSLSLFVGACAQEDIDMPSSEELKNPVKEITTEGISPDIIQLKSSDAEIVAKRFINNNATSRGECQSIKNIVAIPNAEGETVLYAVNLDKGYVLVSATKDLSPILAVVDNGSFSLEDKPTGRDIIISQLVSEADYWKKNGGNNKHHEEWQYFTKLPDEEMPRVLSRTVIDSDPWNAMYAQMIEFEDMGYECCRLKTFEDDQDFMPNDILERFKNTARTEDNIWEDEYGENFVYETAIVVKRDKPTHSSGGFCLNTQWAQDSPYNYLIENNYKLGCITVAVGQIMKFHEHPKTFDWKNMPNVLSSGGNTPLNIFLKRIHDELGVDDYGGAYDQDAERVLKSYGYKVSLKSHNSPASKFPIYCGGTDSVRRKGHAWVCDGSICYTYGIAYELYLFEYSGSSDFHYSLRSEEQKYIDGQTLYHMNWGWGGQHDGYFKDDNIKITTPKEIINYCDDRMDIYITKP